MKAKQRTVNTQPKLYDVYCVHCGNTKEIFDVYKDSYELPCSCFMRDTMHKIACNGGTGYRWEYCDYKGQGKHYLGDD